MKLRVAKHGDVLKPDYMVVILTVILLCCCCCCRPCCYIVVGGGGCCWQQLRKVEGPFLYRTGRLDGVHKSNRVISTGVLTYSQKRGVNMGDSQWQEHQMSWCMGHVTKVTTSGPMEVGSWVFLGFSDWILGDRIVYTFSMTVSW